jgi:hypothetical protein
VPADSNQSSQLRASGHRDVNPTCEARADFLVATEVVGEPDPFRPEASTTTDVVGDRYLFALMHQRLGNGLNEMNGVDENCVTLGSPRSGVRSVFFVACALDVLQSPSVSFIPLVVCGPNRCHWESAERR